MDHRLAVVAIFIKKDIVVLAENRSLDPLGVPGHRIGDLPHLPLPAFPAAEKLASTLANYHAAWTFWMNFPRDRTVCRSEAVQECRV